jgi:3'(2'), 5'-bisphosphate nucleotidase
MRAGAYGKRRHYPAESGFARAGFATEPAPLYQPRMDRSAEDGRLLELAAGLAWQAAELILGIRARGFSTSRKPDSSPVTEADQAAEALITAGLRRAAPLIPVVAEEEISAGHVPRASASYWLVDPLDGTRDFCALRDSFCVNIGLVRDGAPVLGAVALPATAELFGGLIGTGAWKQDGSGRHGIHVRRPPDIGLTVLASRRLEDDPKLRHFLRDRTVTSVTHLGSAIKVVRVAEGAADLYARFGRTMEWDTAGPHAVLLAAGGSVRTEHGDALTYAKPGWANPGFVCTGALAA